MARQEIRSYDYVNHPYAKVREALVADPAAIFRAATRAAAARARSVAAELRVTIAGVDVAAEIVFTIGAVEDEAAGPHGSPLTRIPVSWEAAKNPQFFPLMNSVLTIYPLTATETQLDFLGRYDPRSASSATRWTRSSGAASPRRRSIASSATSPDISARKLPGADLSARSRQAPLIPDSPCRYLGPTYGRCATNSSYVPGSSSE